MAMKIEIPGADTLVMVSSESRYKLHSAQLIQAAQTFAFLLQAPGPNLSREGQRVGIRYLLVLQDFDEGTRRYIYPSFRRIPVDQTGRPLKKYSLMHENEENPRIRPTLFADFDRLLHIFVNQPVTFNDKSVDTLLPDFMGLLEVAERLGAVSSLLTALSTLLIKGCSCPWSPSSSRTA